MSATSTAAQQPLYARLWFQVIVGIVVGVGLGYFYPATGAAMKPLGDAFVKLIRMMIAPIIFGTVVVGIAKMGDMKEVGRIGLRALIYFEVVSTLALVIAAIAFRQLARRRARAARGHRRAEAHVGGAAARGAEPSRVEPPRAGRRHRREAPRARGTTLARTIREGARMRRAGAAAGAGGMGL